jgi:hypothetical protein
LTDKYIDVREALGKTDLLRMGGVVNSVHQPGARVFAENMKSLITRWQRVFQLWRKRLEEDISQAALGVQEESEKSPSRSWQISF